MLVLVACSLIAVHAARALDTKASSGEEVRRNPNLLSLALTSLRWLRTPPSGNCGTVEACVTAGAIRHEAWIRGWRTVLPANVAAAAVRLRQASAGSRAIPARQPPARYRIGRCCTSCSPVPADPLRFRPDLKEDLSAGDRRML